MALIKCPNCKKEISDTTKRCIHCKKRIDGKKDILNKKTIVIIISILVLIIILVFSINQQNNSNKQIIEPSNSENENKEETPSLPSTDNSEEKEDTNLDDDKIEEKEDNKTTTSNKDTNKTNSNSKEPSNNNNTNNSQTSKKIVISAYENKSCPSEYTLSNDSSTCNKTIYINGNTEYFCASGFELVGTKCKMDYTTEPFNGKCVTDAVLENGVCVTYTDAKTSKSCPSGYEYASTGDYMNNKCSKVEKIKPNIEYSCPSGYTLNGSNCEK